MESETIEVGGAVIAETEKAYLFDIGQDETIWLPKSQCELAESGNVMTIPKWLANKKGIG